MEKLFLAPLTLPQKLNIVDYQNVHGSVLTLEVREFPLFNGTDKAVYEFLAAQKLYGNIRIFIFCLMADRVQHMRFAQSDTAIQEKGVVSITRRITYRDTACMGKPVGRADNEAIESIVGMKPYSWLRRAAHNGGFLVANPEFNTYKVAGDILGTLCEVAQAVVLQKLRLCFIGTADLKRSTVKRKDLKIVEPRACIDRVKCPYPPKNPPENF